MSDISIRHHFKAYKNVRFLLKNLIIDNLSRHADHVMLTTSCWPRHSERSEGIWKLLANSLPLRRSDSLQRIINPSVRKD